MTTHLRRYHPQLLSSGSMQAKSTPKPPSTDQAAASTASGMTQPASRQRRQQTLWNQTHQLEQTVSADSVESDTSAGADCVSRLSGIRHISWSRLCQQTVESDTAGADCVSRQWSQTHQLEQTVSADSVEPDTSATPPQLPAVSLAAEETPVESVKVDQLLEDGRATKAPTCLLDTLLTDIYVTYMEPTKNAYQLAIEEVERF